MNSEYDKTGWTAYEPAEFICVDARTGNIKTAGGMKPVFILELYNDEKQISITKFFNCKKTKKDNLAVDKNSDFACVYRATIGEDPRPRYSKAKQLLSHLIGHKFLCQFEEARDRNGSLYFRATKIQPVTPKAGDGWFLNGKLKNKRGVGTRHNYPRSGITQQKNNEQRSDNGQTIIRIKTENELEKANPDNISVSIGSGHVSSTYTHTKSINSSVESLRHKEYVDIEKVSDKEHIYRYQRKPDESYDDYIDSVLNDSLSRWYG